MLDVSAQEILSISNNKIYLTINSQQSTIALLECVCFTVTLDPSHFAVRNGMNLLFKTERILFFVSPRYPHYARIR